MLNFNISDEKMRVLTEFKNMIFIFLLILDFLFILFITFFDVSVHDLIFMASFDLFICLILFIQLCYDYKNYEKGLKSFLFEHIVDIISMIPFNFIFLRYLAVFRLARFVQFFQIFKILKIAKDNNASLKFFIENRLIKILFVLFFIYLLFASITLKSIDSSFSSVFDAFWFNIVTISGVGYGDITPVTQSGKIISMFSIVMGMLFVSIFTAAMSAFYMKKPEEETRNNIKNHLDSYVSYLNDENKFLNKRIDDLESKNRELNEKLDVVIDLLNKKE